MSSIEERLAAMERRMAELEAENRELKATMPAPKPRRATPGDRTPDGIRALIAELSPMERMNIKAFALDVQRYGYDQASIMHGRDLPKRGRKKTGK